MFSSEQFKRFLAIWIVLIAVVLFVSVTQAQVRTGVTVLVSTSNDGEQLNAEVQGNYDAEPGLSGDGQFIVFESDASNIVEDDSNGTRDIFLRDLHSSYIERISVSSEGHEANSISFATVISTDGNVVAFTSQASNLVTGDRNGSLDIFVHDRVTGKTELVSVSSGGEQGNWASLRPSLSSTGRFVAFDSLATNFVQGDINGHTLDVFVHDRETGQTELVSISSSGEQGNHGSSDPGLSHNGRYVVFKSGASNLVEADTNGVSDIFVHDRETGQTERVSISTDGEQANSSSNHPAISGDGRYVAFISDSTNLDVQSVGTKRLFVHDRETGQTEAFADGDNSFFNIALSEDGSKIAYTSFFGIKRTVNVYDQQTKQDVVVSTTSDGTVGNGNSSHSSISADGNIVAFWSFASDLVDNDTNGFADVFVHYLNGEVPVVPSATPTTSAEPTPAPTLTPTPTDIPCTNCELVEVQGKVLFWDGEQNTQAAQGVTMEFIWNGRQKTVTTDQNGQYKVFLEPDTYSVTAHKDNHLVIYEVENVDGVMENAKELILNFQQDTQVTDFLALPCLSPVTGLNICQLEKGDILLEDSNASFDNQAALVTSYFLHTALADTDANIIEAAGENANDERREVRKIAVQHTGFYKQTFELNDSQDVVPVVVNDWVALRVKDEYRDKVEGAVEYATSKAYDSSVILRCISN